MASLNGWYLNPHRSQYVNTTAITHQEGCGWTSTANGLNASTGGARSNTPDYIHNLLPRSQETNPSTPGWSLEDIDHAMAKIGYGFQVRSGQGWGALLTALGQGLYVILQGDSDQFSNNTCSGAFDGDHAVGVHPATRVVDGLRQHWINDPICPSGRWEFDYILRRYAVKLSSNIRFGVFTHPVPKVVSTAPAVTLRYGGVKITPAYKRVDVPAGQRANVRRTPSIYSTKVTSVADGAVVPFKFYQRTSTGLLLAGSRVWYGDQYGTRWMHISSF